MTLDDIFPKGKLLVERPRATDADLRRACRRGQLSTPASSSHRGPRCREAAQITFPRGYLLEIGRWRLALPFVRNTLVRDSVADTLMMHEVERWVLAPLLYWFARERARPLGRSSSRLATMAVMKRLKSAIPLGANRRRAWRAPRRCPSQGTPPHLDKKQ